MARGTPHPKQVVRVRQGDVDFEAATPSTGPGCTLPVFTTACPRNCYSTCSFRVHVEDGRLRRIEAHPDNRATPEGPCLKGLSYVERVSSPDRILHPLKKKPDGSFARIGWDEALDEIAERLAGIRERHGPQAVLYYKASGTKGLLNRVGPAFWRLYGGYTTTYGDLCWPAGLEATRLTLGENKHNAPWDLENARLVVMWGKNPAETNIHQGVFLERALRAGGRLVVIDPRRTETAERAELLIQPRPGSDGAIALAVAHLLVRGGHVDEAFIREHVLGFEEFARRVDGCTPEWAASVAEVPAAQIERLAELLATDAAGDHQRRVRDAALHEQRTGHARDDRSRGHHRQRGASRRRLDVRGPPEPRVRRRA